MLSKGFSMRWAVLFALAMSVSTAWAYASSTAAPLSVSVTVVRSCSIETAASTPDVTLRCAGGVSQVRLGESPSPSPLIPGPNSLRFSTSSSTSRSPGTQLVTIHF